MNKSDQHNNFAGALKYDKAHPEGLSKWWWAFPALVLPVILMAGFDFVSRDRVRDAIKKAPFIPSNHLRLYCNSGRPIKTELYTDQFGIKGEHGVDFAYLWLDQRLISSGRGTTYSWHKMQSAPETLSLFDSSRSISVRLDESELDISDIPVIFEDYGLAKANSIAPESWLALMTVPHTRYRLRALPCGRKVQVVGSFWRNTGGIRVKGFAYNGVGKTEYLSPVVLSIQE